MCVLVMQIENVGHFLVYFLGHSTKIDEKKPKEIDYQISLAKKPIKKSSICDRSQTVRHSRPR